MGETAWEYEVIPFLLNHVPEEDAADVVKQRVEQLVVNLQLQKERVLAWVYCHGVLSAWWHIEDHTDGDEGSLQKARMFERLMQEMV